jgi:spore photoproduct lyase
MPQSLSDILEPNTSLISERIEAINDFYYAGYDVHINFSPIIIIPGAKSLYEDLFKKIDYYVDDKIKNDILAECIMLTHNKGMHEYNLEHNSEVEELLWNPEVQEDKISSYGSKNIRYKWQLKNRYISDFVKLHDEIIPWNKIRYIF